MSASLRILLVGTAMLIPLAAQESSAPEKGRVLDWAGLMERTGTKPIEVPKTSLSGDQVMESYRAWFRTRIVEPEMARLKGPPNQVETREFLEQATRMWSMEIVPDFPKEFLDAATAIIDGDVRRPLVDFMAGYICGQAKDVSHKLKGFSHVAAAPADAPCPGLFRAMAQAEILEYTDSQDPRKSAAAQKRFLEILTAHLAQETADDDGMRWLVFYHLNSAITRIRPKREEPLIEIYLKSKLPEWARLTLAGDTERELSWRFAGSGWGRTFKPEDAASHLKAASTALTRAWELKPAMPFAAQAMIIVTEVGESDPETLRLWFDRAMAAQFDFEPAFRSYLNATRPHWGGSFDQMLGFGRACAETKRFDSDLPTRLNEAVFGVANDVEDWRALYRNRGLSTLLLETRENRMKAIPEGQVLRYVHAAQLCAESWAAGDLDRAVRGLDALHLGNGRYYYRADDGKVTHKLGLDYSAMFAEIWLHKGAAREDYGKGVAAMEARNFDEAMSCFQSAVGKADPAAQLFLGANMALATFQQRYNQGGWAPLPLRQPLCWKQVDGENNWDPKSERLKLTGPWLFGRSLFRGSLGARFEVRGHFSTVCTGPRPAGLGIYCGISPVCSGRSHAFWWSVRIDSHSARENAIHFAHKYHVEPVEDRVKVRWSDDNTFLYRRDGNHISFFVDDREILHDRQISDDAPSGECAWGLGVLGQGKGAYSQVWNLEARRLDKDL